MTANRGAHVFMSSALLKTNTISRRLYCSQTNFSVVHLHLYHISDIGVQNGCVMRLAHYQFWICEYKHSVSAIYFVVDILNRSFLTTWKMKFYYALSLVLTSALSIAVLAMVIHHLQFAREQLLLEVNISRVCFLLFRVTIIAAR